MFRVMDSCAAMIAAVFTELNELSIARCAAKIAEKSKPAMWRWRERKDSRL